jgi:hypothetical protein
MIWYGTFWINKEDRIKWNNFRDDMIGRVKPTRANFYIGTDEHSHIRRRLEILTAIARDFSYFINPLITVYIKNELCLLKHKYSPIVSYIERLNKDFNLGLSIFEDKRILLPWAALPFIGRRHCKKYFGLFQNIPQKTYGFMDSVGLFAIQENNGINDRNEHVYPVYCSRLIEEMKSINFENQKPQLIDFRGMKF